METRIRRLMPARKRRHKRRGRHPKLNMLYNAAGSMLLLFLFCVGILVVNLVIDADAVAVSSKRNQSNVAEIIELSIIEAPDESLPVAGVVKAEKESEYIPVAGVEREFAPDPDDIIADKASVQSFFDDSDFAEVSESEEDIMDNSAEQADASEKSDLDVPDDIVEEESSIDSDLYLAETGESIELTDEFLDLCAMIHYEAGEGASVESKAYVAHVAMNRLKNVDKWGYSDLRSVLYAPGQFNVVGSQKFNSMKEKLRSGNWDEYMKTSVTAANLVYSGSPLYDIDDSVQYFYGNPDRRQWGSHEYCFTFGGNSFFK